MVAKKSPLRVVAADEVPEPKKILSLVEAVELGDYLEILLAQRREIAESIPEEKGPAKAALHRQLSLIAKEIEGLELRAREEGSDAADLAEDEDWTAEAL